MAAFGLLVATLGALAPTLEPLAVARSAASAAMRQHRRGGDAADVRRVRAALTDALAAAPAAAQGRWVAHVDPRSVVVAMLEPSSHEERVDISNWRPLVHIP